MYYKINIQKCHVGRVPVVQHLLCRSPVLTSSGAASYKLMMRCVLDTEFSEGNHTDAM